ncbi:hypothetical protein [Bacillus altitudinis]|uniref:hypothetical protein n=1 Tax=Bacillus altitudinis TaxID=293387 RepID=UPI001595168F|nr:hypothetical protein [Bacillus altitudinis]
MTIVISVMDLGAFIFCTLMFIVLWFEESEEAGRLLLYTLDGNREILARTQGCV